MSWKSTVDTPNVRTKDIIDYGCVDNIISVAEKGVFEDWEEGTCDFSDEVWEQMLESGLRYGQGEKKPEGEAISENASGGSFWSFFYQDMEARNKGMIPVGYPSEDVLEIIEDEVEISLKFQVKRIDICKNMVYC